MWNFPEFVLYFVFVIVSLVFFSILLLFSRFAANKYHSSTERGVMLLEHEFWDASHDSNPMQATFFDCTAQDPTYTINSIVMEENIKLPAFSLEDLAASHKHPSSEEASAMVMGLDHLQHQLSIDLEHELQSQINWQQPTMLDFGQQSTAHHQQSYHMQQQQIEAAQDHLNGYVDSSLYPDRSSFGVASSSSDILNHLELPMCTVAPTTNAFPKTTPISFSNAPSLKQTAGNFSFDACNNLPPPVSMIPDNGPMLYDSNMQLGYPTPPSQLLRELYHSLPQNYGFLCGADEREAAVGGVIGGGSSIFQEMDGRHFENSGLDHRREMLGFVKGEGKATFATERQRREQLNEKYKALRSLIPNPTKSDRASIVGDTIEYIKELIRTIKELKILVENKRNGKERRKMQRVVEEEEDDAAAVADQAPADMESSSMRTLGDDHHEHVPPDSGALVRSSWLQRRYKESFVDVRIVDDEVNIKLTARKKIKFNNCLLYAAKALDELHLDLVHAAGGNIGDHNTYMFNTKIGEGSSVYASAVAKKILQVVDAQAQQHPPPSFQVLFQG